MLTEYFQFLADTSFRFLDFLFLLLPYSPDFTNAIYHFMDSDMRNAFGVLNWFVPVSGILSIVSGWAWACLMYVAVRWALSSFGGKG